MKLTKLTKAQLVEHVTAALAESLQGMAEDLYEHVLDLETGRIKPVCTWTRTELLSDIIEEAACLECDAPLTTKTAYVTDDDSKDLVCKSHQ